MLTDISTFIQYSERVRRRTLLFFEALPADRMDWVPRPGQFSCGDLIRHIGAAEHMFAGVAVHGEWHYPGHGRDRGATREDALAYVAASHTNAIAAISTLAQHDLQGFRTAVGGRPIEVWRILMLMIEHEIHHRSQFAEYLTSLDIEPPQIYGLTLEELVAQITT